MVEGWIQVFVLVLTECVAPAGKTVCQEQELRYEFLNQAECEVVLEQLLAHKDNAENIIVNREKSSCFTTAKRQSVFSSLADANDALSGAEGWREEISLADQKLDFTQEAHRTRLGNVPDCDEVAGVAPCKIGEIIIEGAQAKKTQVWRKAN